MLEQLLQLGFVEVGEWALVSEKPRVTLVQHKDKSPALYALVEGERIVYIGKSVRTLRQRMQNYQTPGPSQRTSRRNHASIAASLGTGKRLRVFVLHVEGAIEHRGVPINLAAGLEDPLIAMFRPAWNVIGSGPAEEGRPCHCWSQHTQDAPCVAVRINARGG